MSQGQEYTYAIHAVVRSASIQPALSNLQASLLSQNNSIVRYAANLHPHHIAVNAEKADDDEGACFSVGRMAHHRHQQGMPCSAGICYNTGVQTQESMLC